MSVKVVAEVGVNHNGDLEIAKKLITEAVDCEVDFVKFQTFRAESLVTKDANLAEYQNNNISKKINQLEMLKQYELSFSDFICLADFAKSKKVGFLTTAFDNESLNFILNNLDVDFLKISSGDLTNSPFLLNHAVSGKNLVISTGMATVKDVELALSVVAFGYISGNRDKPSSKAFQEAYKSREGKEALSQKVTLLQCTSEYPVDYNEVNLLAMGSLRDKFGVNVGFSDHSRGLEASIASVALGASIVEKHFTLDVDMIGPDHKASLVPKEFYSLTKSIRNVEKALGTGMKVVQPSEKKNIEASRKSIVAKTYIEKGTLLSSDNLAIKRTKPGLSPIKYWNVIGKKAKKNFQIGEIISV